MVNAHILEALIDPHIDLALCIARDVEGQVGMVSDRVSEFVVSSCLLASVFQV